MPSSQSYFVYVIHLSPYRRRQSQFDDEVRNAPLI